MVSKKEAFYYLACIIIIICLSALTKITVDSANDICDAYCKCEFKSNCVEGLFNKGGCNCYKHSSCPYLDPSIPDFMVNIPNISKVG